MFFAWIWDQYLASHVLCDWLPLNQVTFDLLHDSPHYWTEAFFAV